MESVFEMSFPIRYHELDSRGSLRLVTLLNYLQDAAGMHAGQLGVSVADLRARGLTWVLSRIHLLIGHYPKADETVVVWTWPATCEGLTSCREFELSDSRGKEVARATTSWMVLNMATGRPVRIREHLPTYPLRTRRAVEEDFSALPTLPEIVTKECKFQVLRDNLDVNNHVNNTVFATWALESVPDDLASGFLTELEIAFRAEALYGESIVSRCAVLDDCCLHQIVNQRDGKELARVRTRWSRDPQFKSLIPPARSGNSDY